MSSNIRVNRICQYCGEIFGAKTTVTKYCGDNCAKRAYKAKIKMAKIQVSEKETVAIKSIPLEVVKSKDFLTVKDVAQLLNSSTRTIYDMINCGRLKAVNLSQRKTMVRRGEIDHLFTPAAPTSVLKVEKKEKPVKIADCYTIGQAEKISGMSNKAFFDFLNRNNVKKMKKGKFVYIPKKIIDQLFE